MKCDVVQTKKEIESVKVEIEKLPRLDAMAATFKQILDARDTKIAKQAQNEPPQTTTNNDQRVD